MSFCIFFGRWLLGVFHLTEEEVKKIKERILEIPQSQCVIQLSAISNLIEGSGTVVSQAIKGTSERKRQGRRKEHKKVKVKEDSPWKKKAKVEEEAQNKKNPPTFVAKFLDFNFDRHWAFIWFFISWDLEKHDYIAMQNKIYGDTKEKSKWYKDHSYISFVLNRINSESSGTCSIEKWMSMPPAVYLISYTFKSQCSFFPPHIPNTSFIAFLMTFSCFVVFEHKSPAPFPSPQVLIQ
ncbi:putative signal peptide protein [Puccinia sorghi]|uniref:Putative signal peptide protein n=1 Tax=Puccinia sorghi TaxID=27349 RepID=A0A0L6VPN6_9BASI|nr:putative signal peptide protein [Puccinia sorghi]